MLSQAQNRQFIDYSTTKNGALPAQMNNITVTKAMFDSKYSLIQTIFKRQANFANLNPFKHSTVALLEL
ncbi:Uncharacterized protein TCM_025476 [Theobroma cacao]|uniref:Uncharacterized protein n=1 Tax=Theobroma cacao TaxID=3641 RepID=A0A061EYC0_THECC|nr:Uncharacterized protein TCM_025476 [Theobroma cacao]